MTIFPGIYRIKNKRSGTYISTSGSSPVIHGWENMPGQNNQKWLVERLGDGYSLKNVDNNRFVYVSSQPETNRAVTGSDEPKRWNIVPRGVDLYTIYLHGTNLSIDLHYGISTNGTPMNVWGFIGSTIQLWEFEPVGGSEGGGAWTHGGSSQGGSYGGGNYGQNNLKGGGTYYGDIEPGKYVLKNVQGQTVADVSGARTDEAPVIGYRHHWGDSQTWIVERGYRGYSLRCVHAGTYLSFLGEPRGGMAVTATWEKPDEFEIRREGRGHQIILPGTTLVVELDGGRSGEFTPLLWRGNNYGQQQCWLFERRTW